ncbi:putative ribonuclease H protein At1g65750 family [Senna tora]|uniref:Putative ribonuclease H protein At1g65750 family n=1 Tax=Senna tora TaxID=362788 RepID=A0A834TK65_9FABA|nr:putative ribonuclease H protein At1g65750 family [Senna tora]
MQTTVLPSKVFEEIEKRNGAFIWGDSDTNKKVLLVSWSSMCKTKPNGGLGLRHVIEQNKAFMVKLGNFDSWKHVQDGMVWRIGDGKTVRFWSDPWLPNVSIFCSLLRFVIVFPPCYTTLSDRLSWKHSKDGSFSTRTANHAITGETMGKRGLTVNDTCSRCNLASEDLIHMLRDCNKVKFIWLKLVHPTVPILFIPFSSWL